MLKFQISIKVDQGNKSYNVQKRSMSINKRQLEDRTQNTSFNTFFLVMRCSNYKNINGCFSFYDFISQYFFEIQKWVYVTLQILIGTYKIPNIAIQFSPSGFSK